ncbi:hypothetical protein TorRG33x02_123700 [Trema orientale]|uniref:Uncharacterized protein n=1 Tax=Trema orientale TaxID=63057 RepID=A0A2P5F1V7_TREOI|nr:hypothetical protein TorRG33x02_123700 [Trema orientale]
MCPPRNRKSQQKLELMVRPPFPRIYHESQMPNVSTISEVAVIFSDTRKIGDLVDWFTDGCYWSGIVTKILEDETFQDPVMGMRMSKIDGCGSRTAPEISPLNPCY